MKVALSKVLQLLGSVDNARRRLYLRAQMKTVSYHWSTEAQDEDRLSRGFHWLESDLVLAHINELISGDPELDWANYVFSKYLLAAGKGLQRALSLGCGDGRVERHMRRVGACDYIDALDMYLSLCDGSGPVFKRSPSYQTWRQIIPPAGPPTVKVTPTRITVLEARASAAREPTDIRHSPYFCQLFWCDRGGVFTESDSIRYAIDPLGVEVSGRAHLVLEGEPARVRLDPVNKAGATFMVRRLSVYTTGGEPPRHVYTLGASSGADCPPRCANMLPVHGADNVFVSTTDDPQLVVDLPLPQARPGGRATNMHCVIDFHLEFVSGWYTRDGLNPAQLIASTHARVTELEARVTELEASLRGKTGRRWSPLRATGTVVKDRLQAWAGGIVSVLRGARD